MSMEDINVYQKILVKYQKDIMSKINYLGLNEDEKRGVLIGITLLADIQAEMFLGED